MNRKGDSLVHYIVLGEDFENDELHVMKHFHLKKGQRVLIDFPFSFTPGETACTEINNWQSPIGIVDTIMYQVISKNSSAQLSFKIMRDCLFSIEPFIDESGNLSIQILEEYQIAFISDGGINLVISKKIMP